MADAAMRGVKLLHDPVRNKGTAFSEKERDAFGLRGLLPPRVLSQDAQVARILEGLARQGDDLERYVMLASLQDRNETLYYRVLVDHIEELMPIVYTPTVGQACQVFGHIFQRPRGLYVSAEDRGSVDAVLANWPHDDVRIVVVTDGERILGLGDLGAYGMGIPIGKLALYTACAGIHPTHCLPVLLDVGTNNQELLRDPLYTGLPRERLRGDAYDALVEEFVTAAARRFPDAVIQFEDFATAHAFDLVARYQDRVCTFDDDIQGTGAVALAGLLSALRVVGGTLSERTFLFLGAGEAGIGIGDQIVAALVEEGLAVEEARRRCWFMDSKGLVVAGRGDLVPHKRRFAHEHPGTDDLLAAVRQLRPAALLGVSGTPGGFTRPVIEALAGVHERPIVFALSNPTSKSECTARQAYEWSGGRALFASGSPFAPVDVDGRTFVPGQGNNAYIFPGVGLGAIVSRARAVTDEMFTAAARVLASEVTEQDLSLGRLYPPLARIRDVSARMAPAVAEMAWEQGLARAPRPDDPPAAIRSAMFEPRYEELL
ncbi:MAG: NAD-dependent malic enzyme [Myxococcota bacterium]